MDEDEPVEEVPPVDLAMDVSLARKSAFINEADPVFFKWQRGEATRQDWLDAVASVKLRYPKPED